MLYEDFQHFANRYLSTVKGDRSLNVQFGGSLAYTNGTKVNIPNLPPGTIMTPWQQQVYHGYLDHELAHVRWTDFSKNFFDRQKNPLLAYFTNVLEDIRIENLQILRYPGSRLYLDSLCQEVDKNENTAGWEDTQASVFIALIYKYLYIKFRDCNTNFTMKRLEDYPQMIPIKDLLDKEVPTHRSTSEVHATAVKLMNLLPKNVDWKAKAKQGDLDDGLFSVLDLRGMTKQEIEALFAFLSQTASDMDSHELKGNVMAVILDEVMELNLETVGSSDSKAPSMLKAKDKKQKRPQQNWGDRILPPFSTDNDKILEPAEEDLDRYNKVRDSISAELLGMKKALTLYLRSKKAAAWSRGLEEGKLDPTALYKLIATKDKRVMRQLRARDMMDTSVEMTIDLSGSMDEVTTMQAAILMNESLSSIPKMKFQITGFRTNNDNHDGWARPKNDGRGEYGRIEGFELVKFKGYDEPTKKGSARLGSMECNTSTPLGDAYAASVSNIMNRKEGRRVLVIVSDGDPAITSGSSKHSEPALMRAMHRRARFFGIETIGLFIGRSNSTLLKSTTDVYIQVNDKKDLARTILTLIRERIVP